MGPSRRYRRQFPANRRQKPDHSSYVQSLFREFLRRNQQQAAQKLAPIPEKPHQLPVAEANRRPNLYRESIDRILRQNQSKHQDSSGSITVADQQSIVKRFFQSSKSNAVPESDFRSKGPLEPVYARFKRRKGTDQFVKCDVSPGAAPGGLIRWLEDRKRERLEREQRQRTKKVDEYLNLPGHFFSGRPLLPFETARKPRPPPPVADKTLASTTSTFVPPVADKTLASITSTFVPPVASTPLNRPFPVAAICSPIISDPDEIQAKRVIVPKPKKAVKGKDLKFIEKFKSALDSFSQILMTADGMVSSLDRNYAELQRRRARERTSRANETSMVINVQFGCDRKSTQSSPTMDTTWDSSFEREVFQLVTPKVKSSKPFELDPLLTYSPPCPIPDPDLGLPLICYKTNIALKSPSISSPNSAFMKEFLKSPIQKDLEKTKSDNWLDFSPPSSKPPKPKVVLIRQPEPDFSFEYSQEDFKGPIFPSQDGGGGGDSRSTVHYEANLDFDETSQQEDSFLDFSFSQDSWSDWF